MTDQRYQLSALLRSSGLGVVFSDASGLVKTNGKLHGDNLEPVSLHYSWTGENSINFARLIMPTVHRSAMKPITNRKDRKSGGANQHGKCRCRHPRPFLSLLVRQGPEKGDAFCRTPVRLYDGRRLARLNPEDMEGVPFDAAPGRIACRVRWEPIAGYPKKTYERAEDMRPVNLEFAAIANSGFMAPREVSVMTRYGTVSIVAVEPFRESNMPVVPAKLELPSRDDDTDDEDW